MTVFKILADCRNVGNGVLESEIIKIFYIHHVSVLRQPPVARNIPQLGTERG